MLLVRDSVDRSIAGLIMVVSVRKDSLIALVSEIRAILDAFSVCKSVSAVHRRSMSDQFSR